MNKIITIALFVVISAGFLVYLVKDNPRLSKIIPNQKVIQTQSRFDNLFLPDLKISKPHELRIEVNRNIRHLRFDTRFINQGKGALEIIGNSNLQINRTVAIQKIKKIDGSMEEKTIGEFVYHPNHDHWHIEKFSRFELWSYKTDGSKDQLKATTDKMSFCIWDMERTDSSLKNSPTQRQYSNCQNNIQGLSVGWSDIYSSVIPGQELEIKDLPDGKYLVSSVINPDKTILESDYSNNETTTWIEIKKNTLTILEKF